MARRDEASNQVKREDIAMRCLLLTSVAVLAGLTAVATAETPVTPSPALPAGVEVARVPDARLTPTKRTVYLNRVVLEELKKSNPGHYAQAQRVMAEASALCAPNGARLWQALDIPQGNCSNMTLKTSYPPKREITFVLDDTMYIALVTVKDAQAYPMALPDKVLPPGTDAPAGSSRAK
jgi:hypothetical protein